jgi:serpin B
MKKFRTLILLSLALVGTSHATIPVPLQWWVDAQPLGGSPIVKSLNVFAHNLYQNICTNNNNCFFSPYSISTALSMTYLGANGATEKKISKVFGSTLEKNMFIHLSGNLLHILKDSYETKIVNKLYVGDTCVLPLFQKKIEKEYMAHAEKVDFSNPEQAANKINSWVSKETNEKINQIVSKKDINEQTKIVLANAIYFKEAWRYPFDPNKTEIATFYKQKNKTTQASMMTQEETFFYMENEKLQMLELPYNNDNMSMLVLLPKKVDGLAELQKSITQDQLDDWQTKLVPRKVFVKLPKFKLEMSYNLNEPLKALGMTTAFSTLADFSGINGKKDLYISNVSHKAYINVTEQGTEASAATAVVMNTKSAGPFRIVSTIFNADHPFTFIIRENNTGIILFMGNVCTV